MPTFVQRTSIHGRRLGISSSGGITSSPSGSTDIDRSAQMWGPGLISSISSAETIPNSGVNILSTAAAGALTYTIAAPVAGVRCEVISQTTSSGVTLNTTATTINFNSSGGTSSTALTMLLAGGTEGQSVVLRGLSATQWQVVSRSGAVN